MTREQVLERLRSRCSRAEYSSGQAYAYALRYLDQTLSREMVAAEIVAILVDERFIDDSRFAGAFVRDKLKFNGWGKQKIVYRLKALGIAGDVISKAIGENYSANNREEACEVLQKLVEKKWKSLGKIDNIKARRVRVIRFALGRGFDYEDIVKCLNNIV